ncbi:MAG: HlyD family efflux transporter periplasmic adaptor subunit [bacterium]|nr:HlyD family efflux transporter periplasmic adaptor subunit [bacterium]
MPRTIFAEIKQWLINSAYFVAVFVLAFGIATQALVRRVNGYEATKKPLFFSINKENIILSNSVAGRIENVAVSTGEHVHKGDLLVSIVDDSMTQRIIALKGLANNNISAETELETLKSRVGEYEIRAPRDGVIYYISAAEGSYLNASSPILTMFADSNVKIMGMVNQEQYTKIQQNKEIDVYSPRFEQVYKIIFTGVGRVQAATNSEESKFEIQFRFADEENGAAFIEGEQLEMIARNDTDDAALKPSFRIAKLWNNMILGD